MSKAEQGMIDFNPDWDVLPESIKASMTILQDGTTILSGDADPSLNRDLIGSDEFTLSYGGLRRAFDEVDIKLTKSRRENMPHISVVTEVLDDHIAKNILDGKYLGRRRKADSLRELFEEEGTESHSMSYAVLMKYTKDEKSVDNIGITGDEDVEVHRGIEDAAIRLKIAEYIHSEMAKEHGQFFVDADMSIDDIEEILTDERLAITYSLSEGGQVDGLIIIGESPDVFPYFNRSRIEALDDDLGVTYDNTLLVYLALTGDEAAGKRRTPILFFAALKSIIDKGAESISFCLECSPRSIVYSPYLINRAMRVRWVPDGSVIERTVAYVSKS